MNENKFFSCILDDFQDYIYDGFASLLNKSRSANVGVVFSHQALGDLDKVSESFRNQVLTCTNIKVVMRMNDPDTCEYFAKLFGTKTTEKVTEKTKDEEKTGDGTIRVVEEFNYHPNIFKKFGTGVGVVGIPHQEGFRHMKVKFMMRENLPAMPLPAVEKIPKKRVFCPQSVSSETPSTPQAGTSGPQENTLESDSAGSKQKPRANQKEGGLSET